MNKVFTPLTVLGIICLLAGGFAVSASAAPDSRMAGTVPGGGEANEPDEEQTDAAEEPEDIVKDVDFGNLESLGLIYFYKEGAVGRDVWHSMKRSEVVTAIVNTEPGIKSTSLARLAIKTFISGSDAKLIDNDIAPEPGSDIFTLRLQKLLEFGLYDEALDMYSLLEDTPYHPETARAGVLAMLGSGNPSLACLEGKTFSQRFSSIKFWRDLETLCDHTMAGEQADDDSTKKDLESLGDNKLLKQIVEKPEFRISYRQPLQFDDFTVFETTALFANHRVVYSGTGNIDPVKIPARILGLMLSDESLPESLRFSFAVESVRRGLKGKELIDPFYNVKTEKQDEDSSPAPEDFGDWTNLPELYNAASEASHGEGLQKWLFRALEITPHDKWPALLPFAQMLNDSGPGPDMTAKDMAKAIKVIFYAEIIPENKWNEAFLSLAKSDNPQTARDGFLLLTATSIMNESLKNNKLDEKYPKIMRPGEIALLEQAAKALDISNENQVQTFRAYEKQKELTFGKDYVMPSVVALDCLDRSFKNKLVGGGILFSAIALTNVGPEEAFPGLVRQVVGGLGVVGKTTTARRIAVEAVLGLVD